MSQYYFHFFSRAASIYLTVWWTLSKGSQRNILNQKEPSLRNARPVEMDEQVQLIRQSMVNASQLKANPYNSWDTWMGKKYLLRKT